MENFAFFQTPCPNTEKNAFTGKVQTIKREISNSVLRGNN